MLSVQVFGETTYKSDDSATVNELVSEARPEHWVEIAYPKKTFSTVMDVSRNATWPRASKAKVVKKPATNTHGQSTMRRGSPAICAHT